MANKEYTKLTENGLSPVIICSDNGDDTYTGIGAVDVQGVASIPTKPSIAQDDVARGLVTGAEQVVKFAIKDNAVAASGEQTVWEDTSNLAIMTSAATLTITYNNSTDGVGTTGALSLFISYLDANFELQSALHTLGGTGSEVTSFTVLGVNRVVVFSSGTADMNTNAITLTDTSGATGVQAYIPALAGVTQQLVYHLPINSIGIIKYISASANKVSGQDSTVEFKLYVYSRFTETRYLTWDDVIDTSSATHTKMQDPLGIPVSGRDVIYMVMDTSRSDTLASARLSLNQYATA